MLEGLDVRLQAWRPLLLLTLVAIQNTVVADNTAFDFIEPDLVSIFHCTARNARQALDMISVAMPTLVVTDYDLPGMSTAELMKVLGSTQHTANIPVIIMLHPGEIDQVEISGCTLLKKPVQVEDLYPAVQAGMEPKVRSHIRVPASFPVTVNNVTLDSTKGEGPADLSALGLYIRTLKYYHPQEQVALQLTIGDRTIKADGVVVYTRRQDAGPYAELGMAVKFTRIMAEDRELGYIDCEYWQYIDWAIIGGESGKGCRPMELDWALHLVAQSRKKGVPVFVKQLGGYPNQRSCTEGVELWPPGLQYQERPFLLRAIEQTRMEGL